MRDVLVTGVMLMVSVSGLAQAHSAARARTPSPGSQPLKVSLIDRDLRCSLVELTALDTQTGTLVRPEGPPVKLTEYLAIAPSWWVVSTEVPGARSAEERELINPPSSLLGLPAPRPDRSGTTAAPMRRSADDEPATASDPASVAVEPGVLVLTDGQRIAGRPLASAMAEGSPAKPEKADSVSWASSRMGIISAPLDVVKRVELRPTDKPRPNAATDVLRLVNGDVVLGFVEGFGGEVVVEPTDASGKPTGATVNIDASQIASVDLSNPPVPPATGPMVWLGDGSVLRVERLKLDAGASEASLAAAILGARNGTQASEAESTVVSLGEVTGVSLDGPRLVPISTLKSEVGGGQETGRRIIPPAKVHTLPGFTISPLGCDDLELPGPMTASWALPVSSRRVAGWLVLDEADWAWGDCEVKAWIASGDIGTSPAPGAVSARLNAMNPSLAINLEASGGSRLVVRVEAGENGPIQDRITLRHGLVLVEGAEAPQLR